MPDVSVPDAAQALERADYWLTNAPCESAADGVDHDLIADLASALRAALAAAPLTPCDECETTGQNCRAHRDRPVWAAAPPDDEPATVRLVENLPAIVRAKRQAEGLSHKSLGDLLGISDGDLCRFELGKKDPRLSTVVKLVRWAAAGSPPPTPDDRLTRLRTINEIVSHQMDVVGDVADSLADRPDLCDLRKALWRVQSEVSQAIELDVAELVPLSAGPPPTNGPTRQQIDELQRLHDAATPAPWRAHDTFLDVGGHTAVVFRGEFDGPNRRLTWLPTFAGGDGWDTERNCWADADLIVAMRNALPELLSLLASHRPDNDPEHQT